MKNNLCIIFDENLRLKPEDSGIAETKKAIIFGEKNLSTIGSLKEIQKESHTDNSLFDISSGEDLKVGNLHDDVDDMSTSAPRHV